ncbi:hypothetical protein LINPERHAP1_LOCUS34721, partial [Linum perenne]
LVLLLTEWSIGRPANFPKVVTPTTEGRSTTSSSTSLMVISPEVVHQTDFSFCLPWCLGTIQVKVSGGRGKPSTLVDKDEGFGKV